MILVLKPVTYLLTPVTFPYKMKRLTLLTNPDKCNLHCPLCFLNQRDAGASDRREFGMGEMPLEVALAAIEKYAAECDDSGNRVLREVIPSTMGEPLLYSHFDELLEFCRTIGIPLNLTTNGTFPGKWGSDAAMETLLRSCSDIKVSYLASEQFDGWNANVKKLMDVRNFLIAERAAGRVGADPATVSLQVTLHRKNQQKIPEIVSWASAIGINRIKWNPVVFLRAAPAELQRGFALNCGLDEIRKQILDVVSLYDDKVKSEGALFMNGTHRHFSQVDGTCPFTDEVWILPDGSEDHCPSPERRYGEKKSECCFLEKLF